MLANERDDEAADDRQRIVAAMRLTGGNKTRAAAKLGITRPTLYKRLEKYGIEPKEWLDPQAEP